MPDTNETYDTLPRHLTDRGKHLLLEVADHLEQYPHEFSMESWVYGRGGILIGEKPHKTELCDTTCCIAGWVALLNKGVERPQQLTLVADINHWADKPLHRSVEQAMLDAIGSVASSVQEEAIDVLFADRSNGQRLFHVNFWPYRFRTEFEAYGEDRPVARAALAADYLRLYVETDGKLHLRLTEEEMFGPDGDPDQETDEYDWDDDEDEDDDEDDDWPHDGDPDEEDE